MGNPAFLSWEPIMVANSPYSDLAKPADSAAWSDHCFICPADFPNTESMPPMACSVRLAEAAAVAAPAAIPARAIAAGTAAFLTPAANPETLLPADDISDEAFLVSVMTRIMRSTLAAMPFHLPGIPFQYV